MRRTLQRSLLRRQNASARSNTRHVGQHEVTLQQLRQIHALCLKHEDYGAARLVDELIKLHAEDGERFWELLTSHFVWGGPGSLADQCLMHSPTQSSPNSTPPIDL